MNYNMDAINEHRAYIAELQAQLDAANARIAELEAAQAWVSVDERLPDDDEVLTYERDKWGDDVWCVDSYSLIGKRWLGDSTPTHWMPLPPTPATNETEDGR